MSKFGKTKKQILELLSKKQQTLTDLSAQLELSPSTIKQHLEELEALGAIMPVENEFIRRWKYYRPNPTFTGNLVQNSNKGADISRFVPYLVGAVVLMLIGYGYSVISYNNANIPGAGIVIASGGANLVSVSLTDPPYVPMGTNALYINYTSVELHTIGSSNGWIQGKGSGTLNLLSLVNTSQVIGDVYLNPNSTIDRIRFNITSARIVINSINYSVAVPYGQITAQLPASEEVSANSSVLLDFSPTVATVYTANGTAFMLVPSVRTVNVESDSEPLPPPRVGATALLVGQERLLISNTTSLACSISNASLTSVCFDNCASMSDNATRLTFTVQNTGNTTVDLTHAVLLSNLFPVGPNVRNPRAQHWDVEANKYDNSSGMIILSHVVSTSAWTAGPVAIGHANINAAQNRSMLIGLDGMPLMFTIQSNGMLTLPFGRPDFLDAGYALAPGASATFTFGGRTNTTDGGPELSMHILPGQTYRLLIFSSNGYVQSVNVTTQ